MNQKQVAQMVATMAAAYPYAKVTVETSVAYERMLVDLDHDVAQRAVARLIGTSKFMPTIAEIREAATSLRLGPARTGGEAWIEAIGAVRKVGIYGVPIWSEPVLNETMRMWGSWQSFCRSPEDDPGGRARFIELYEQLVARQRADVVSGIALPAPQSAPRLTHAPRQIDHTKAETAKPRDEAIKPTVGSAPTLEVSSLGNALRGAVPPRPVSQFAGRKMSAEEIEAAMEAK